ncbi:hypothetical protein [Azospirillum soli]|uniref:hypothetical protein n=1 Tax=Azospirillum soli TaxID=1304799 RepID=UPI001AEAEA32|nr:hypothetical protein [Azospirillum soli]MBP2313407.1 hypothetical protein [Azospirillum soli]
MVRFARAFCPAFCLSATLVFGGGGTALGQTVADYQAALAAAPITQNQPLVSEAYCRPVLNYVFTSVPSGERYGLVLPLVALGGAGDPAVEQKRAICEQVRRQAVIQFDAGTGEEIVTPPQATDGSGSSGPYYPDLPQMGSDRPPVPGSPAQRQRQRSVEPVEVR